MKSIKDQNTGSDSCDTSFLIPNLQLLPESLVSAKMVGFPICKVTAQADRFNLEKIYSTVFKH